MPSRLSILQNFRDSMVRRDPFPYLVIENALPAEIYEQLAGHYPSESFIFENRRGKQANEAYQSNKRYDLPAAHVAGDNTLDLGLWRDFIEYHTSQDFLDELLSKLGDVIADTHPELISRMQKKIHGGKPRACVRHFSDSKDQCEIALDCQVGINSPVREKPTSVRAAHLDNPNKLLVGLFYFRRPGDNSQGGDLEICSWENPNRKHIGQHSLIPRDRVTVKDTVTYGPNKLAMFVNNIDAIHGVTVRGMTEHPRRLVNIVAEVYPTMDMLFNDRPFREDRGVTGYLKRKIFGR
jgi:hypothetical protein